MKENIRELSTVDKLKFVACEAAIALGALAVHGVNGPQLLAYQHEGVQMPEPADVPGGRMKQPRKILR